MWRDFRFALRAIGHRPASAVVVAITLALGIGGSTAIFSVFSAVLLRELPYPEAGQVYLLRSVTPDGSPTGYISPAELRPFYDTDDNPIVEAAALAWSQEVQILGSDGRPHSTTRYGVTDQFFEIFGTHLELGRPFERGQQPGTIVIAYSTWRDMFASDPDIIGKSVQAEGIPRQVVGVTRADFEFPGNPGYWYLMRLGTYYDRIRGYLGFVRLRPGRTRAQFQSVVTSLGRKLGLDPVTNQPSILFVQPFLDYVVGNMRTTVTILFGATAILLLIACINVTNLLVSQATARAREMALREALGARRWRVVRQLLSESILLAFVGGALGLAGAVAGIRMLLRIAPPDLPRLETVPIDGTVLLFSIGVTALTGILIGLVPAWRITRNPLRSLIHESGRGAPGGPARTRLFSILVVTEVALAVLLVIGAGLLVRSYFNLTNTDPGFTADRVLTFFMYVPGHTEFSFKQTPGGKPEISGSYAPMAAFFRELLERIGGLPGVEAVATSTNLPLDRWQYGLATSFMLPDKPGMNSKASAQTAETESVSSDFFRALEIGMLAGRSFRPSDRPGAPGVAIVNETFVRRFLFGRDPLGQRIRFPENPFVPTDVGFQLSHRTVDELEVIGVVKDVKYMALAEPPEPRIYLSSEQWINRRRTVVVRTTIENPESLIASIRREIASMDPLLSVEFALYPSVVRGSLAGERLETTLLVVFGSVALLLAAVGIYGLMSYSVAQRRGEIAVRSAMGASALRILGLVMGRGVILAAGGVVLGVLGAAALRKVVASQLYGVTALDFRVFLLASAVLLSVAVLACFLPARRATQIEPVELLRIE